MGRAQGGNARELLVLLDDIEGLLNAEGAELSAHGDTVVEVHWQVDEHVDEGEDGEDRAGSLLVVETLDEVLEAPGLAGLVVVAVEGGENGEVGALGEVLVLSKEGEDGEERVDVGLEVGRGQVGPEDDLGRRLQREH